MDIENNVSVTTENENGMTQVPEEIVESQVYDEATTKSNKIDFTDAQKEYMNRIIQERVNRERKSIERKYEPTVKILKKGLGTEDIGEINRKMTDFYTNQGIEIQPEYQYEDEDLMKLASLDANEIKELGYDEIVSRTNELQDIGVDNLTPREKYEFKNLAEERQRIEQRKELESIGVKEDVINSSEFKDFASKFNSNQSIRDIYELYSKVQPEEPKTPMGTMKTITSTDEVKEYYSPEEFDRLTPEQLNNPKIWDAVMKSREKWINLN